MIMNWGSYSSLCARRRPENKRKTHTYTFLVRNPLPHAILAHTAAAVWADHGVLGAPYSYNTC